MIVKMKKVTLLVSSRERKKTLDALRKLGVLHIKHVVPPEGGQIQDWERTLTDLQKAERIIGEGRGDLRKKPEKVSEIIREIIRLQQGRDRLTTELEELQETAAWFSRWGEISRDTLDTLAGAGVPVRFYIADRKAFGKLPEDASIHIHSEDQGIVYFAHFPADAGEKLPFREDPMPQVEFSVLSERLKRVKGAIEENERMLRNESYIREAFPAYRTWIESQLETTRVARGMGDGEQFVYLQGFVPAESIPSLNSAADREGWGTVVEDPDNPEEVPTLVRTPRWLRIIQPLFNFMGTVPGYNEYDISFWFLLFFSLFFGMIVGDAGYGLIFMLLTWLASRKMKSAPRQPFILIMVLSGATMIWGAVSGNWFGFEKIARIPVLSQVVIDKVDSFASDNQDFMMYFCFIIAVVHLTIARAVKVINALNTWRALADVGWIAILWTLFFMAGNLVLGRPLPGFVGILFAGGITLCLVFTNFQKNVLKGVLTTLMNLPLDIINSFSDVVSYLRLFAVSYASVTVASSFNNMAVGSGIHSFTAGLLAAFILFFGHALNIMLGLMSVIVHGIRLNMLEFSGHLDMQWAGKDYRPFKERS
jgi:V/A-type H+-transporting ATPase subunit I